METRDPGAVLDCRRCGAQITDEHIDRAMSLARCRHCHAVFGLADPLSGETPTPAPPDMPLPRGLTISERGDTLQLVRRWLGLHAIPKLLPPCIFFTTMLVYWYREGATLPDTDTGDFPLWLGVSIFLLAVVAASYTFLAFLLNRTIIEAGPTHLSIRHGPVPWEGNREIPVGELEQLFCREHVSRGKHGTNRSCSLNAVLANGRTLRLLQGLPVKQLLFLERALEKHLGIANRPISGELRR